MRFQNSAAGADLRVSGCAFVLVDQSSQYRAASDPVVVTVRGGVIGARRDTLQCSVWPAAVVVGAVLGEDGPQVPFAEDQDAVGEFGSSWITLDGFTRRRGGGAERTDTRMHRSACCTPSRPWPGTVIATECSAHDYTRPGKPKIDWDDPQARDALVSALVNDANRLVEIFTDLGLEAAAEAVALLALVAGQDVEPAEGSDGTDGGGGSRGEWPGAGHLHRRPAGAAHPQVPGGPPGRIPGTRDGRAGPPR